VDAAAQRQKLRQLADDLTWLEEHCRKTSDLVVHAAHLRLASAVTRNVIGPAVDGQGPVPVHVAVIGGAGAGKSTVVNFLVGAVVADANPQAGFTRHPTAFVPAEQNAPWPSTLGFLGPLQRLNETKSASLDQDVYQVERTTHLTADDPFIEFVVWDCPDMTTWASANYVSRLMEVVALADVVVYVASDERYNDEVPTQFLHLVLQAGKPVVCCLTKMREADQAAFVEHFTTAVLHVLPTHTEDPLPLPPVVALPNLPAEVRKDPAKLGAPYRAALLNAILALVPNAAATRTNTVKNAMSYLQSAGDGLLDVARRDLSELDQWRGLVRQGQAEFEERYTVEYLSGEAFRRFDKTHAEVMQLLELPGPGRVVSRVLSWLRMPFEWLSQFIMKTLVRPPMPNLSEQAVCSAAMEAWLTKLQAEALRRSDLHPIWKQVAQGFNASLKSNAMMQFTQRMQNLERKETAELDAMARSVPTTLESNPVLLNILRVGMVAGDIFAVVLLMVLLWPPTWWWLIILPVVGFTRQVVQVLVRLIVDRGRTKLRDQRQELVETQLTGPLTTWLSDWPTTSGTPLERLQQVLRRVPDIIRELPGYLPEAMAINVPTPPVAEPPTSPPVSASNQTPPAL
jgi:hypothetical protein